jgi:hypothetical protein
MAPKNCAECKILKNSLDGAKREIAALKEAYGKAPVEFVSSDSTLVDNEELAELRRKDEAYDRMKYVLAVHIVQAGTIKITAQYIITLPANYGINSKKHKNGDFEYVVFNVDEIKKSQGGYFND